MPSALIVVDMQEDFVSPGGALYVPGAETIVRPMNAFLERFFNTNQPVIFTRDWHPRNHRSFVDNGGEFPTHCVADTVGSNFYDPLLRVDTHRIYKGIDPDIKGFSGFSEPGLLAILRARDITHLYICGVALEFCVRATAFDARTLDFDVSLLTNLTKAVTQEDQETDIEYRQMRNAGIRFENSRLVML
jgi:nicotinamidase/pyrazinamidase